MNKAISLLKYHVESEPEDSNYALRLLDGDCKGLTYIWKEAPYGLVVTVVELEGRLYPKCSSSVFEGVSGSKTVMAWAGMHVKAVNLMRQLEELS